jgi:hypothetical protein
MYPDLPKIDGKTWAAFGNQIPPQPDAVPLQSSPPSAIGMKV